MAKISSAHTSWAAEPRQAPGLRVRDGRDYHEGQGDTSERGEQHHRRGLHIEGFTPP